MTEENGARAARIREAIAVEDYRAALRLWEAWAGELRASPRSGMDAAEFGQARALIEWSRGVLAGAKARRAATLAAARTANAYAGSGACRVNVIRTSG